MYYSFQEYFTGGLIYSLTVLQDLLYNQSISLYHYDNSTCEGVVFFFSFFHRKINLALRTKCNASISSNIIHRIT